MSTPATLSQLPLSLAGKQGALNVNCAQKVPTIRNIAHSENVTVSASGGRCGKPGLRKKIMSGSIPSQFNYPMYIPRNRDSLSTSGSQVKALSSPHSCVSKSPSQTITHLSCTTKLTRASRPLKTISNTDCLVPNLTRAKIADFARRVKHIETPLKMIRRNNDTRAKPNTKFAKVVVRKYVVKSSPPNPGHTFEQNIFADLVNKYTDSDNDNRLTKIPMMTSIRSHDVSLIRGKCIGGATVYPIQISPQYKVPLQPVCGSSFANPKYESSNPNSLLSHKIEVKHQDSRTHARLQKTTHCIAQPEACHSDSLVRRVKKDPIMSEETHQSTNKVSAIKLSSTDVSRKISNSSSYIAPESVGTEPFKDSVAPVMQVSSRRIEEVIHWCDEDIQETGFNEPHHEILENYVLVNRGLKKSSNITTRKRKALSMRKSSPKSQHAKHSVSKSVRLNNTTSCVSTKQSSRLLVCPKKIPSIVSSSASCVKTEGRTNCNSKKLTSDRETIPEQKTCIKSPPNKSSQKIRSPAAQSGRMVVRRECHQPPKLESRENAGESIDSEPTCTAIDETEKADMLRLPIGHNLYNLRICHPTVRHSSRLGQKLLRSMTESMLSNQVTVKNPELSEHTSSCDTCPVEPAILKSAYSESNLDLSRIGDDILDLTLNLPSTKRMESQSSTKKNETSFESDNNLTDVTDSNLTVSKDENTSDKLNYDNQLNSRVNDFSILSPRIHSVSSSFKIPSSNEELDSVISANPSKISDEQSKTVTVSDQADASLSSTAASTNDYHCITQNSLELFQMPEPCNTGEQNLSKTVRAGNANTDPFHSSKYFVLSEASEHKHSVPSSRIKDKHEIRKRLDNVQVQRFSIETEAAHNLFLKETKELKKSLNRLKEQNLMLKQDSYTSQAKQEFLMEKIKSMDIQLNSLEAQKESLESKLQEFQTLLKISSEQHEFALQEMISQIEEKRQAIERIARQRNEALSRLKYVSQRKAALMYEIKDLRNLNLSLKSKLLEIEEKFEEYRWQHESCTKPFRCVSEYQSFSNEAFSNSGQSMEKFPEKSANTLVGNKEYELKSSQHDSERQRDKKYSSAVNLRSVKSESKISSVVDLQRPSNIEEDPEVVRVYKALGLTSEEQTDSPRFGGRLDRSSKSYSEGIGVRRPFPDVDKMHKNHDKSHHLTSASNFTALNNVLISTNAIETYESSWGGTPTEVSDQHCAHNSSRNATVSNSAFQHPYQRADVSSDDEESLLYEDNNSLTPSGDINHRQGFCYDDDPAEANAKFSELKFQKTLLAIYQKFFSNDSESTCRLKADDAAELQKLLGYLYQHEEWRATELEQLRIIVKKLTRELEQLRGDYPRFGSKQMHSNFGSAEALSQKMLHQVSDASGQETSPHISCESIHNCRNAPGYEKFGRKSMHSHPFLKPDFPVKLIDKKALISSCPASFKRTRTLPCKAIRRSSKLSISTRTEDMSPSPTRRDPHLQLEPQRQADLRVPFQDIVQAPDESFGEMVTPPNSNGNQRLHSSTGKIYFEEFKQK